MVWGIRCPIGQSTQAQCTHVCTRVCAHAGACWRGVPIVVANQTFALSLTHTSPSYAFKSKTSPFWNNTRLTSSPPHFFRIKRSLSQHCGYFQCRKAGLREKGSQSELQSPRSPLPRCRVPLYRWAGSVRPFWDQVWAWAPVQMSFRCQSLSEKDSCITAVAWGVPAWKLHRTRWELSTHTSQGPVDTQGWLWALWVTAASWNSNWMSLQL